MDLFGLFGDGVGFVEIVFVDVMWIIDYVGGFVG